jgi:catechol 2,3-dioxygenase-like lactoylglutathione lyase family enzyme
MAGIKGLAHIGVYTANAEKSLQFYVDTLGFEQFYSCDLGKTKLRFVRAGSCIIELIQPEDYKGGRGDGVVAHIAIEVEDIRGMVASLKAKGVKFNTEDVSVLPNLFPTGSTNIFLAGPDGESLELYEYIGA